MSMKKLPGQKILRIRTDKSVSLSLARGRMVVMIGFFVLAYSFVFVRAFDLTIMQSKPVGHQGGEEAVALAEDVLIDDRRGDVYDRNGMLLAASLKMASLYADPYLISDHEKAAVKLAQIFPDLSADRVLGALSSDRRFVWIKRNITPEEQHEVLEIGEPGLGFRYEHGRIYPQRHLASHLIGFTNVDGLGQAGIERGLQEVLSEGREVTLALDIRLQHVLRRELLKAVEDFEAKAASGVIMDARTGDVLAAVSLPDFDPHHPGGAVPDELFNRFTLGVYELGSVFKVFSTASLFEVLSAPMGMTFDAREPIKRGRHTISDYHAEERVLTVPEAFIYSSNIASALMGEAVGTQALKDFYYDLGLLTPLDFELEEVSQPLVPNPWREINTLTASFGHGVATTPLQLAAAVSSVVNGGTLVRPRLVRGEGVMQAPDIAADIAVVSKETSRKMRQLLRLAVVKGTGAKADVPGYRVGGKTGTAEKIINGKYDRSKLLSSFVGVFPVNDPQYTIFVMVDEPKGQPESAGFATGGWVAAPAVGRIVKGMAAVLGLEPQIYVSQQNIEPSLRTFVSGGGAHE